VRTLSKEPEPQILLTHGAQWTQEYLAASGMAAAEKKKVEKWGHKQIRETLATETSGRCAYCESRIGHVSYPHVEHIIPKSRRAELAHVWWNLTTACEVCNIAKADYWDATLAILNPYVDEVESRLVFWGDIVDWVVGDEQAELTIKKLKLNRFDWPTGVGCDCLRCARCLSAGRHRRVQSGPSSRSQYGWMLLMVTSRVP